MISLAIIILLTYFMCVKRKVKYFPVQLVFMLIQGIYIILSGSRTIMLCMVIFSVFLGNIILNIAMPYKAKDVLKKEVLVRIVVSVVSAVVMLGLILGMKNGIVKLNWMLNNGYSHHKEIVGEEEEEDDEILERNDVGEGNMSNGRIDIWKSYIECSKDSIIWGASPANALKHAQMIKPKGFLTKRPYEPHNGYLAIYVNTGIVGSCIMLIFIISILLNLKEYIKAKGLKDNEFLVLTSFVASYAFYAVFFYEIFFKNNFTSVIFWLMLGFYNVFLIKQKNEKEIW